MKNIRYFDRGVWLASLKLQANEVVCVAGRPYRYNAEKLKDGRVEFSLTPVDGSTCK